MSSSTSSSDDRAPADDTGAVRYLVLVAALVLALLSQVWLPNARVDPFWYFGGNRAGGPTFAFATREAKLHRLHRLGSGEVDCLIAGSSRAQTLDPTAFDGLRCANLAVEAATLPESLALLQRAADVVPTPKLVVQEIANFDLEVPACEQGRERATAQATARLPGWWERYASLDVLRYSRRLVLGQVRGIGYDAQWRPVLDAFPPYEPRWSTLASAVEHGAKQSDTRFTSDCIDALPALRSRFPDAHLVGYVAPVSPDLVLRMQLEGVLDENLRGMHAASRHFDAFYDLAAPSELTDDLSLTWDGSHFHPSASERIAAALVDDRRDHAVRVDVLSLAEYGAVYAARLDRLRERLPALASSRDGAR